MNQFICKWICFKLHRKWMFCFCTLSFSLCVYVCVCRFHLPLASILENGFLIAFQFSHFNLKILATYLRIYTYTQYEWSSKCSAVSALLNANRMQAFMYICVSACVFASISVYTQQIRTRQQKLQGKWISREHERHTHKHIEKKGARTFM